MTNQYYSDEEEEFIDYEQLQILEDEEFDKACDILQKQRLEFEQEAPFGVFNCLNNSVFEDLIFGDYKPLSNYFQELPKDEPFIPLPFQYIHTIQDIIEEKKNSITFAYQYPRCYKCINCTSTFKTIRGRRKVCKNRGKIVIKPAYPELLKLPIPPPPEPKTRLEEIVEKKEAKIAQTGNPWGNIKQTQPIDFDKEADKAREEQKCKIEESRLKTIKDEKKKKKIQEQKLRRYQDQKLSQDKKQYFKDKRQRQTTTKRKTTGRFGNLL